MAGAVAAQHPRADGVEGAHGHLPPFVADEGEDALAHLRRRLVGEGHGQDLPGRHALDADEIGDAMRQDARLAGAGAGQDEQRSARRRDGAGLLGVEAGDDGGSEGRAVGLAPRLAAGSDGARAGASPRPWRPPWRTTRPRRHGRGWASTARATTSAAGAVPGLLVAGRPVIGCQLSGGRGRARRMVAARRGAGRRAAGGSVGGRAMPTAQRPSRDRGRAGRRGRVRRHALPGSGTARF